ncbi:MAG: glycosyltransferase family 4 protein [Caldiserica bacterium]|nr:glycosyltransferase family 4 protein [Caldisericota bacterium]
MLTFFLLLKEFLQIRPHIVHTHSSKAGILGRWAAFFAGVPRIYHTIHGFPFHQQQFFLTRQLYVFLEQVTSCISSRLIAITREDIKKGLAKGIGRRSKYLLIRDGIEIKKFRERQFPRELLKKALGIKEELIVGTVSCLKPQKNPLDFVRMAGMIPGRRVGFIIVGDGILRKRMEEEIYKNRLNDRFYLLGWREDVEKIIKIFDVFVLTSLWEGLPKALLEAMASGLPPVVTKVDGMKEIIEESKNGFLIPPGDYKEMAGKVKILLQDKTLREKIGEKARESVKEEFEISGMVSKLDNLYRDGSTDFSLEKYPHIR